MTESSGCCDACGDAVRPRLVVADGRSLCLACVERQPNNAGIEADALKLLRWMTRVAELEIN